MVGWTIQRHCRFHFRASLQLMHWASLYLMHWASLYLMHWVTSNDTSAQIFLISVDVLAETEGDTDVSHGVCGCLGRNRRFDSSILQANL